MYTQPTMLVSKFNDLRRRKGLQEGRDISTRAVATETGLSLTTVQRASGKNIQNLHVHTLEKLCAYFEVKSLSELVEYVPDKPEPPAAAQTDAIVTQRVPGGSRPDDEGEG